jgi:hypothetical protein
MSAKLLVRVKPKDYELYYDVIKTDQVPPETIAYYFEDKKFLNWFRKNQNRKATWE